MFVNCHHASLLSMHQAIDAVRKVKFSYIQRNSRDSQTFAAEVLKLFLSL